MLYVRIHSTTHVHQRLMPFVKGLPYPLDWYRIRDKAATEVGTQKLASYRSAREVSSCSIVEHLLGLVGTSNCDFPWGTDGGREERGSGRGEEENNLQPTCIFESRKLAFHWLNFKDAFKGISYIPTLHAYLPGRKSEFILYPYNSINNCLKKN